MRFSISFMRLKKMCAFLLSVLFCLSLLPVAPSASADSIPSVVVTTFPIYDWVRSIAGDTVQLTLLLDSGVDLHSFQPTAQDIMRIADSDLFIYIGGESDDWVEEALSVSAAPERQALNLMEVLGSAALEEETVEGMQAEEEEEEEGALDEHIWLSLRNARILTEAIAGKLSEINPGQSQTYADRLAAFTGELDRLDGDYAAMVAEAPCHTVLFGDRFPFRYLIEDYGLDYFAAFSGCSAETEASFATIAFLAGKLNELKLPAVLTIEGTNHRIAETIVQASASGNQPILVLDSMQGTTLEQALNGANYLEIMRGNLETLRLALGGSAPAKEE